MKKEEKKYYIGSCAGVIATSIAYILLISIESRLSSMKFMFFYSVIAILVMGYLIKND